MLTRQITDDRIWERETADGFIGTLAFWWASAGTAYYLGYSDALRRVTPADISRFIATSLVNRPSVLSLRMSTRDYERERGSAAAAAWTLITRDNAYWWAGQSKGGGR